jgi:hypothetical protein
MTWFDALVIAAVVVIVLFEMKQETGRGILDTCATLAAAQFCGAVAPGVTAALGWKPLPGTEVAPLAQGLCFLGLWIAFLLLSRTVHRQTRWTMDHFDPFFGVAFALVIAATAGHVAAGVAVDHAKLKHGQLPEYLSNSAFADELRSFKSYHYVISVFHGYQEGR